MSNGAYSPDGSYPPKTTYAQRRASKGLPPLVENVADLDKQDEHGVTYRKLWHNLARKFYENDPERPVDYTINDSLIIEYSMQLKTLSDNIDKEVEKLRTWQQFAKGFHNPYFTIEWSLFTRGKDPVQGACGCGCG